MPIILRPATAADQRTIRKIVRDARLYPFGLHWQNFTVAESGGKIVAVGQVKSHRDGSRELASLAVLPAFQGRGVGGQIVHRLISQEKETLHLFCGPALERYYRRFGFETVAREALPPSIARLHRMGNWIANLVSYFISGNLRILAMRRVPDRRRIGGNPMR
jgi:N-acetylglutamate synthase-like GNAT family acetyltransferase